MMRHRFGPVETLSDAIAARRLLWVLCKSCGHAERFDPRHVMALKGPMSLRDMQTKLRCRRCGRQRAAIVINDEGWPARD
jgi:hypothetical protein